MTNEFDNSLLKECISKNLDVTISMKASDLIALGRYLIDESTKEVFDLNNTEDIFYSVAEVLKIFNIKDRSTLWRYAKRGYLVPVKIGKMLRYRKSDIDTLLKASEDQR